MSEESKILLVDDEPNILQSYKRNLRGKFRIDIATGPDTALKKVISDGPYSVIVSDMQMPGMNGVEFLGQVVQLYPDTSKIILTGNNDQETATLAINKGHIFKFLTKPCSVEDIENAINEGINIYKQKLVERELLANTLNGSIKLLTDILAMLSPVSFSESIQIQSISKEVASELGVPVTWDIELAAMLANIGMVALPPETQSKLQSGEELNPDEQAASSSISTISKNLLQNIPRLKGVSNIVYYSSKYFDGTGMPSDDVSGETIPIGSRILCAVRDLIKYETQKKECDDPFLIFKNYPERYDLTVVKALVEVHTLKVQKELEDSNGELQYQEVEVTVDEIKPGLVLAKDLRTNSGLLLIKKGYELTELNCLRLKNFVKLVGLDSPIVITKKSSDS